MKKQPLSRTVAIKPGAGSDDNILNLYWTHKQGNISGIIFQLSDDRPKMRDQKQIMATHESVTIIDNSSCALYL
jgi:hypothetical protein